MESSSVSKTTKMPAKAQDPYLGLTIDGAIIEKKLGEGGMGSVYLARHLNLEKYIAIKILPPAFAREPQNIERFMREARSAAKLEHPNIVQIYNAGEQDSIYFISMQFVEGQSLESLIKEKKRIPISEALWIMQHSMKGLYFAHKRGIIHRDLKPDNIMITSEGELKVVDFGLARSTQAGGTLSSTGQIIGTPYFMSPEQCNAESVDQRTDIYALGITFYYMLSGIRPYDGSSAVLVLMQHVSKEPAKTLASNIELELPVELVEMIEKMMAKELTIRPQNLAEILTILEPLLRQIPPTPIYAKEVHYVAGIDSAVSDVPTVIATNKLSTDGISEEATSAMGAANIKTIDLSLEEAAGKFEEVSSQKTEKITPLPSSKTWLIKNRFILWLLKSWYGRFFFVNRSKFRKLVGGILFFFLAMGLLNFVIVNADLIVLIFILYLFRHKIKGFWKRLLSLIGFKRKKKETISATETTKIV